MRVEIAGFAGEVPRLDAARLPRIAAQMARDVDLRAGTLRPWGELQALSDLSGDARSLMRVDGGWYAWRERVSPCRGPVPEAGRLYWSIEDGVSRPRVTDPTLIHQGSGNVPRGSHPLGSPAPLAAPTATVGGGGSGMTVTRSYLYTWVSPRGEEGPPSPVSVPLDVAPDQPVTVGGVPAAPPEPWQASHWRLYRTASFEGVSAFHLVREIKVGETSHVDDVADDRLAEPLHSAEWEPPPAGLKGLVSLGGGILAGHRDHAVHFSEPWHPHAWPAAYTVTIPDRIIGIAALDGLVVVLTDNRPWLVSGADSASMQARPLGLEAACLGPRGIVAMTGQVLYPARTGLISAGPRGAFPVTADILTEREWAQDQAARLIACQYRGLYVGLDPADGSGVVIDPAGGGIIRLSGLPAQAVAVDPVAQQLAIADGARVLGFDGPGVGAAYRWRSRLIERPTPGAFGYAQVDIARPGSLTLTVVADGRTILARPIPDRRPVRLPGGFRAVNWSVELAGTAEVRAVTLADHADELAAR